MAKIKNAKDRLFMPVILKRKNDDIILNYIKIKCFNDKISI